MAETPFIHTCMLTEDDTALYPSLSACSKQISYFTCLKYGSASLKRSWLMRHLHRARRWHLICATKKLVVWKVIFTLQPEGLDKALHGHVGGWMESDAQRGTAQAYADKCT
jgi:hypothetical protein